MRKTNSSAHHLQLDILIKKVIAVQIKRKYIEI